MNMKFAKFSAPVLGAETHELYAKIYGANGERFLNVLDTSPDEITVISRLIAYLSDRREKKRNGYPENS